VLGLLAPDLLSISPDLRLIALIVILLRAGLELSRDTLNRVGRMVILLSAIPATFEGVTITILGPHFLPLTYMESAIHGSILGAVSPAAAVPLIHAYMDRWAAEEGFHFSKQGFDLEGVMARAKDNRVGRIQAGREVIAGQATSTSATQTPSRLDIKKG